MYLIDWVIAVIVCFFHFLIILANFRDPSGGQSSIKGIRLNVCDVGWRPPQTVLAKKMLTEAVASFNCDKTKHIHINGNFNSPHSFVRRWQFPFNSRNYTTWHSFGPIMVRTMARNIFIGPISSRSWVYTSFFELFDCFVQFGSESVGKCQQFDTKSANDAECNTAKITKMVKLRNRYLEQLRYVAWWLPRRYNKVIWEEIFDPKSTVH